MAQKQTALATSEDTRGPDYTSPAGFALWLNEDDNGPYIKVYDRRSKVSAFFRPTKNDDDATRLQTTRGSDTRSQRPSNQRTNGKNGWSSMQ